MAVKRKKAQTPVSFTKRLYRLGACEEARQFTRGKTLREAWRTCTSGSWMSWWLRKGCGIWLSEIAPLHHKAIDRVRLDHGYGAPYSLIDREYAHLLRATFTASGNRKAQ